MMWGSNDLLEEEYEWISINTVGARDIFTPSGTNFPSLIDPISIAETCGYECLNKLTGFEMSCDFIPGIM